MTGTPKGYWVGHATVRDIDRLKQYPVAAMPEIADFGGQMPVRGGQAEIVEGPTNERTVVIEFP